MPLTGNRSKPQVQVNDVVIDRRAVEEIAAIGSFVIVRGGSLFHSA